MKTRNLKVVCEGKEIYSDSLKGASKSKRGEYIRELMEKADDLLPIGTLCFLYYQQDGAKSWACYKFVTGETSSYAN